MGTASSRKLHSNSDKGDGAVRYILSGEGAGTIFIIDEVTGDIHAAKSLDRERKSNYVLHAQALDRYTEEALEPKSEFIIKVQDINDNAPKFPEGPFVASVPEMSEVATDPPQPHHRKPPLHHPLPNTTTTTTHQNTNPRALVDRGASKPARRDQLSG
ncbi:hypothetical protein CRUP_005938 [Coryphaenoides rupestris]|nr:hypothetical protein CRUP_005938 [Coryphaenoides rupestris]